MQQLSVISSRTVQFCINTSGHNKDWNKKALNTKFEQKSGSINSVIEHIKAGHALCASVIDGTRTKENFAQSSWVLVDFDHGWSLKKALEHPFVANHASLIYTTSSHQTKGEDRFRVLFLLNEPIRDIELYEAIIAEVLSEFPHHDPSCKDGVRVFYGNTEANFPLINSESFLPKEFQDRAIKALEDKVAIATNLNAVQFAPQDELDAALVAEALLLIPPRNPGSGTYQESLKVLMALHNRFGPDRAQQFIANWSPDAKNWHPDYKLQTFKREGVTLGSLFFIASKYGFNVQEATKRLAKQLNRGSRVQETQLLLSALSLTPDEIYEGYFESGHLPPQGGLALIDGAMGSGKTSKQLTGIVEQYREQHPEGKILSPGLRNLLLRQNAQVLGIEHIEQLKSEPGACDKAPALAYCWDSAWRINVAKLPDNPLLILDEAELGFLHLLSSSTISAHDRPYILAKTRELFTSVIKKSGYIVAAQYGITNITLEFIYDLCGQKIPTEFIKSTKKGNGNRKYTVFSSPAGTWGQIEADLSADPKMGFICCADSQKWLRETAQWLIENQEIPADKVWVLDGDSSEEPWAKDFAKNPDEWIKKYEPQVILYSPSIQMGVSIEEPAFERLYFHLVHLEPRAAIQLPDRYRVNCPRYGYIRPSSSSSTGGSFLPEEILSDYFRSAEGVNLLTGIGQYLQNEQGEGELIPLLLELQSGSREEYTFWLKHLAKFEARSNYEKARMRELITSWWQEGGHDVNFTQYENGHLTGTRQHIGEQLQQKASIEFAAIETKEMEAVQASEILMTIGSTKTDRETAKKVLLEQRLPGVDLNDPQVVLKLVIKDSGRYLKATQLLWAMQHPREAIFLDKKSLITGLKKAKQRGSILWIPALRIEGVKADLLNRMPLKDCLSDDEYSLKNSQLETLKRWALFNRREIKRVLRLEVKPEHSVVDMFNKFARKLGYHPQVVRKEGKRGNQIRIWQLIDFHDQDRQAVLAALSKRFEKAQEGIDQSEVGTGCSTGGYKRDVTTGAEGAELNLPILDVEFDVDGYVDMVREVVATSNRAAATCLLESVFGQATSFESALCERVGETAFSQIIALAV